MFNNSFCRGTRFVKAKLTYCDFSHADISGADMSQSTLIRTKFHQTLMEHTIWKGANKTVSLGTDPELAAAENWQPVL
ncbi:MAG: hypothetical protein D3903_09745 [Candidatus Electrothrix sp. GM3_4]|nr:hypothetical protein [Candidatus Electrothrix sp. GM3_4]